MFRSDSMKSLKTKCDLRSLCFEKPFLFVGMGSDLHILKTDRNGLNELILTKNIFKTFVINKIQTLKHFESDSRLSIIVSICGNRFLTIYEFSFDLKNKNFSLKELLERHNFYDWILSLKMIGSIVFVVKAHNEVIVFDWKTKNMKQIKGNEKCILYSVEIMSINESNNSFVISSGTVFKEIIIWRALPNQNCAQFVSTNLQRLRGHDGVIFALNYNKSLNLLISASDDRSVRIWTSNLKSNEFCDSIDFWNKNKFSESHVFYGHLSRIWCLTTIINPFPIVLSVGEDSSLCFWNINEKKMIQRVDGHNGSSIWSLCVDSESLLAFFGGSDSSLTICDINNSITPYNCVVKHNSQPKQIKLMSFNTIYIFCSTIKGEFQLLSPKSDDILFVNQEFNQIFQTYSAIEINEKRNLILLGSKCGTIASIEVNDNKRHFDIQIKRVQNTKVFSICFINSFSFIVCGIEGKIKLLSLKKFSLIGDYFLPNSKHRWPTAALLFKQLLIIGDRNGSVFIYFEDKINPIKDFNHLHGSNGVTALKVKPNSQLMYSSGKNGKIFEFLLEESNCSLLRIFRIFSDMEFIENFEFDEQTNEISLIYGFQSRNFVIWDERQQRYIESIDCGGSHRSWDFTIYENNLYFCYTKQENIISFDKQISKVRTDQKLCLSQPSHSKKINCCSLLFVNRFVYFATAGENNIIHINVLDIETNDWRIDSQLFGHISNICAISCSSDQKDSCFMVSVGGRAQLMFWKIYLKENQLICKQLFNKFLWSNSIQNKCQKSNHLLIDPQIRYLDVNMSQINKNQYLISTACSDSSVRLFIFNCETMSLDMFAVNSFNTSCILRVLNVFTSHIITASNDGALNIWSFDQKISEKFDFDENQSKEILLKNCLELRLHECGINALDVFDLKDNFWLLVSGGDDNNLSLVVIKDNKKELNQISRIEEKYFHSSQITGLKIISNSRLISASIDQRIIVWKYFFDSLTTELNLKSIASHISSIADISSLCLAFVPNTNKWKAIICGEGFEELEVQINE